MSPWPSSRVERALFLVILLTAGVLRFAGIDHHLARGAPDFDERQNFVDPILRMWRASSPDPTVYAGYPGFFNWLAFLPVGIGERLHGHVGAYVGARSVVAAFGVLSTILIYIVIRRRLGPGIALFGAALLAVSRVEVRSAHHVTPDVLIGTAALGLLALLSRPPSRRRDLGLGALVGLATAVKYTALLLGPAAAAGLLVERRLRAGLPAATAAGALAFLVAAPYAVFRTNDQGLGLATGLETYYGSGVEGNRFAQGLGSSFAVVPQTLAASIGVMALLLAVVSLGSARGDAPVTAAWVTVLTAIVVMAPANLVNPRHVVPAAAAAVFLAASGLARVRWKSAAAGLAAVALAGPAVEATRMVERYRRTPAVDRAATWLETHVPGPARVATSLRRLALAPDRFEVRYVETLSEIPREALAHYDAVVASTRAEAAALGGLRTLATFPSEDDEPERTLTIAAADPPRRSAPVPAPADVTASQAGGRAALAVDGDPGTAWDAPAGSAWIELRWPAAHRIDRVEVDVGMDDRFWPQTLSLLGQRTDGPARLDVDALRPTRPSRQRPGAPFGQVYILTPPSALTSLRIERGDGTAWRIAEIRVLGAPIDPHPTGP